VDDERKLSVSADIGGYTKFMRLHRTSLAHAEVTAARLLERIVDAVPELHLVEVESIDGPLPPLPDPSVASRMSATVGMLWSGLPYMVGLCRPRVSDELPAH
jgi:hypothetical protein